MDVASEVLQSWRDSGRASNRGGAVLFRVSDYRGRDKAPDNKGLSFSDPLEPAHHSLQYVLQGIKRVEAEKGVEKRQRLPISPER